MTMALNDRMVIRRINDPDRFERINFLINNKLKSSDLIMAELWRALGPKGTQI